MDLRKYYLFQFFNSLAFFSPVIVLFWKANGLNMTQIMLLQSIYSIGVVILELPTGAFADYFGKRTSLIVSVLLWASGLIWYGMSHNFWQFVIGELIAGTGSAFFSGADRAYIHEILQENNKEKDFKKVEGKARSIVQISQAIGSLLGGFIGSISLGLPLIVTGIVSFFNSLIAFSLPRTKEQKAREKKTDYFQIIKESVFLIMKHKRLLWLTLFFASFNGLIWPLQFSSQPYLQMIGVPIFLFGVVAMSFSLISALGSMLTHQFEKRVQDNVFLVMSIIILVSLYILSSFPSIYVLPLWSLFITFYYINQTIISDKVLKIIPAGRVATVLSFLSLLRRFTYAIAGPIIGYIIDTFGLQVGLQINGLVLLFVLGSLLIFKPSAK